MQLWWKWVEVGEGGREGGNSFGSFLHFFPPFIPFLSLSFPFLSSPLSLPPSLPSLPPLRLCRQVCKAQKLVESGEIGELHFAKAHYWEAIGQYVVDIM